MIINKRDGSLSGLSPEDIGESVSDVRIKVKRILFQEDNKPFQAFVCEGNISCSLKSQLRVSAGVSYIVSGDITSYRDQPQLSVTSIAPVEDDDHGDAVIADFLFHFFERFGLTARMSGQISRKYHDDFLSKLMNSPSEVALSIRGLSDESARKIGEELVDNESSYRKLLGLMSAGLSASQAEECGRRTSITPEQIRENPFCLSVMDSFSFSDLKVLPGADSVSGLDKLRIYSAVRSVLENLHISTSSTYFEIPEIEGAVRKLILSSDSPSDAVSMYPSSFELACGYASETGTVCIYRFRNNKCESCGVREEGARIALSVYFKAEAVIKKEIGRFVRAKFNKPSDKALDQKITELAKSFNVTLDDEQFEAIRICMYRPVSLITGRPGTGKTTIMGLLASYFEKNDIKCVFAAPTGRAAKRLSEITGHDALTIHRLLEAVSDETVPSGFYFRKGPDDPIDARVIIVDELSMVDTILFRHFLSAVGKGTSLILIGDPDQLPSVGCGNILSDLLSCRSIPRVGLKTIHRQEEGSGIISNAVRVLDGVQPESAGDFKVIRYDSEEEALTGVFKLYEELGGFDGADVMVLSPTKMPQAQLGTKVINDTLQIGNHDAMDLAVIADSGAGHFLEGDRVIQTRNNYSLEYYNPDLMQTGEGVFNGEIGVVAQKDPDTGTVVVRFEDGKLVTYGPKEINNIELAYAITVHKSQGCEFDDCIVVLGRMNRLLHRRNILYTAITRGKRSVTVIDYDKTLDSFLSSPVGNSRQTSLKDLLAIIDNKER